MMKPTLLTVIALLLTGCAGLKQTTETAYHYTIRHSQPPAEAFGKVELALAETYNNLPKVLVLRQPETGTFVLHPLVPYWQLANPHHARYELKIVVGEGSVMLDFTLGMDDSGLAYPTQSAMPGIKADFHAVAARVAQAVGGTLE